MTKDEKFIVEFARSLPDHELLFEAVDQMEHALDENNTGRFKVASLIFAEAERRGLAPPAMSTFKKQLDEAIEQTLIKRSIATS
jgi:hypothetical protein